MTNSFSLSWHGLVQLTRAQYLCAIMAAWGQACRAVTRAGAASLRRQGLSGAESQAANASASSSFQQCRGMASGSLASTVQLCVAE